MAEQRLAPEDLRLILKRVETGTTTAQEAEVLRSHMSALEASLAQAEKDRDTQAERGNAAYARVDALEQHIASLETQLKTAHESASTWSRATRRIRSAFTQHISDLEKSLENARTERDQYQRTAEVWRKRVNEAADALADVLPGEVGRLDLVARIEALKKERYDWQQRALERDLQVVALTAEVDRLNAHTGLANRDVDRLKAELGSLKPTGEVAEDERGAIAEVTWFSQELHTYAAHETENNQRWARACAQIRRLAAKAQAHEEAVANNAALLAHIIDELGHDDECEYANLVRHSIMGRCPAPEASACTCIIGKPHPGAALMEEHRQEVAAARNEGLETARAFVEKECVDWGKTAREATHERTRAWANERRALLDELCVKIEALKTCTDASCARCRDGTPCH